MHGRDGAVMGRRSRQKRLRRREAARRGLLGLADNQAGPRLAAAFAWADHEGLHTLVPGEPPAPGELEELTRVVQEKMRHAPEWGQIVAQFGPDEAERLLQQFRFELRCDTSCRAVWALHLLARCGRSGRADQNDLRIGRL